MTVVLTGSAGPGIGGWGALVLVASVCWAAGTLWAARSGALPAPGDATAVQLLTGGAALLCAGLVSGERVALGAAAPESLLAFGYLVGVLVFGEPFEPVVLLGAGAILTSVGAEVRAASAKRDDRPR